MARKKVNFEANPLLSGPSLASRSRLGSPYRELPLNDIDVDPDQPRRVFDTEALAELAASIKEYGVLCPILVRVTNGGTYRLIAGERRLRAAKLAGLELIPAIVDSDDGDSTSTLAKQLVENVQRQDLTAMERALAVGQLRDTYSWSVREIGKRLGVSKSFVQRSIDILALPDDLQAALIAGAAESKVLLLGRVEDRETRKELLSLIDTLTREELEQRVSALVGKAGGEAVSHRGTAKQGKKSRLSTEDQRLVQELQRAVGTKVQLIRTAGRSGQGRLVIDFYSNDDLRDIFQRLVAAGER